MKPPPPRLPAAGCVTASANATAIAASTALPPRFMTSTPTLEPTSFVDATMPCLARTGSRGTACDTLTNVNTQTSSRTILRSLLMAFYPKIRLIRGPNIRESPKRIQLLLDPLHQRSFTGTQLQFSFIRGHPFPKLSVISHHVRILQQRACLFDLIRDPLLITGEATQRHITISNCSRHWKQPRVNNPS